MKNNGLVCLLSLSLLSLAPACGPAGPEVLDSKALDPSAKNVTFLWSLRGTGCVYVPDLDVVSVQIDDVPLEQQGRFPCRAHGQDGVTLTRFSPGRYSFKIRTQSLGDTKEIYSARGEFEVKTQDVVVRLDLL